MWLERETRLHPLILPHTIPAESVLENNKIRANEAICISHSGHQIQFYWQYITAPFARPRIWSEPIEQTGSMAYRLLSLFTLTRTDI